MLQVWPPVAFTSFKTQNASVIHNRGIFCFTPIYTVSILECYFVTTMFGEVTSVSYCAPEDHGDFFLALGDGRFMNTDVQPLLILKCSGTPFFLIIVCVTSLHNPFKKQVF